MASIKLITQDVAITDTSAVVTFPVAELDSHYGVAATVDWDTTVFVSAKSETGCTVDFGTAAPAGQVLNLAIFRE